LLVLDHRLNASSGEASTCIDNSCQHQYLVIKQDEIKGAQLTVSGTNDSTFNSG